MPFDDPSTTAPADSALATGTVRGRVPFTALPGRIGPYRVTGVLGEGGMGVVYLAEQDTPVRREVALKVLRAGNFGAETIARFESERHALALMEHPNITRVYDAGVTNDGLPYFVMERVIGTPITDYVNARRLAVRDRVQLCVQLCHAVQHAHQKGIIHRDIKPSNVLVTEADGAPLCKVIDFGIAKATGPSLHTARLTATGIAIGTPAYMSPEQLVAGGGDVDTRTDIYAIGVLLYEVLAGVLPLELGTHAGWALASLHAMADVRAPSVRYGALDPVERARVADERSTEPAALRRALHGDLDAVLLKALDPDRERRYATASDFARDLEHHLHDEPVAATPPSATYRLRKFVRRHRAGVTFASAMLLVLLASTVTVAVQARRLARAEQVAVARQGQAEDLIGFMLGDLYGRLTPLGKLDMLDAVGQRALAYFAAVPESQLSDGETYRRALALQQLGHVRTAQGALPEAAVLLRQALALSARLVARDSANAAWQLGLGHAHFWAGNVEWQRGNVDAALAHFVPFVRISERLIARFPDSTSYKRELASALSNIGSAREAKGDLGGALQAYGQGLALDQGIAGRDGSRGDADARGELALAYNTVGVAQRKRGDLAGALASHRAELAIWNALAAQDPADQAVRRSLANAHAFVSFVQLARGERDSALAEARAARDLFARLVAHDASNTVWRIDLATSENVLAQDLLARGVLAPDAVGHAPARSAAAALPHVEASLALLAPLIGGATPKPRAARVETAARTTLGRVLLHLGRTPAANASARAAVAGGERALARKPADLEQRRALGDAYLGLGDVLARTGDASGARASWSRALALVDSASRATGHIELRALRATALFDLGADDAARPLATALVQGGYRSPAVVELWQRRGVAITP